MSDKDIAMLILPMRQATFSYVAILDMFPLPLCILHTHASYTISIQYLI